jgi:hypothetical protein
MPPFGGRGPERALEAPGSGRWAHCFRGRGRWLRECHVRSSWFLLRLGLGAPKRGSAAGSPGRVTAFLGGPAFGGEPRRQGSRARSAGMPGAPSRATGSVGAARGETAPRIWANDDGLTADRIGAHGHRVGVVGVRIRWIDLGRQRHASKPPIAPPVKTAVRIAGIPVAQGARVPARSPSSSLRMFRARA